MTKQLEQNERYMYLGISAVHFGTGHAAKPNAGRAALKKIIKSGKCLPIEMRINKVF